EKDDLSLNEIVSLLELQLNQNPECNDIFDFLEVLLNTHEKNSLHGDLRSIIANKFRWHPLVQAYLSLRYFAENKHAQAQQCYAWAKSAQSTHFIIRIVEAQMDFVLARFHTGKKKIKEVLAEDPKRNQARFLLGLFQLELNEKEAAIEQFRKVLQELPQTHPSYAHIERHLQLAQAHNALIQANPVHATPLHANPSANKPKAQSKDSGKDSGHATGKGIKV